MECSSVMKTDVECCRRDESVESAAERMKTRNVGFLPVCDDRGGLVGTLTDRDLTIRVLAEHRNAGETRVQDVMTPELVCCSPEEDLNVAEERMARNKKSRIICTNEERRPVGVISLSDIARIEDKEKAGQVMDAVATREARA